MRINDIIYEDNDAQQKNIEKQYRAILRAEEKLKYSYRSRKVIAALKDVELKKAEIEKQLGIHSATNIDSGNAIKIELSNEILKKAFGGYYTPYNSLYSKFIVTVSETGKTNDGYVTKFIEIPLPEFLIGKWDYQTLFKSSKEWRPIKTSFNIDYPKNIPSVTFKDIILVDNKYYIIPINAPQVIHKDGTKSWGAIKLDNFVEARKNKDNVIFIDKRINDIQEFDRIFKTGSDEWIQLLKKAGFENPENWTHWSS